MHFSLKALFVMVAFIAAFLACIAQAGFDSVPVWFVAVVSTIMSTAFYRMARKQISRKGCWVVPAGFLGLGALAAGGFISVALLINTVALLLFSIICAICQPFQRKTLLVCIAACALLGFVGGVLPGRTEIVGLNDLRKEFPIVSLQQRLQYEQHPHAVQNHAAIEIRPVVLTKLTEFENNLDQSSYREWQFRCIHEHNYEVFARSVGFGIWRMMKPMAESLRRPPLRDIAFDEMPVEEPAGAYRNWRAMQTRNTGRNIEGIHDVSQYDFLDADSFGAVIEPKSKVAGFVEHALHITPKAGQERPEEWTIERLELVSLLKFDEPRVYVVDHLPRMDQLSAANVPTRPLDDFESGALQQLGSQEDVVVHKDGNNYRMLGSLRAAKQCADCHSVEHGELLGAFSYTISQNASAGN
jgi:hypothetical protein